MKTKTICALGTRNDIKYQIPRVKNMLKGMLRPDGLLLAHEVNCRNEEYYEWFEIMSQLFQTQIYCKDLLRREENVRELGVLI